MPITVSGGVEVRPDWLFADDPDDPWLGVIRIETQVEDSNDTFGSLFGVMNFAHFRPLAPGRGAPRALSAEAARDLEVWAEHAAERKLPRPTWISWAELAAADWTESAERPDSRLQQYERDASGAWVPTLKAAVGPHLAHILADAAVLDGEPVFRAGQQWEIGGVLYRAETRRRGDALGPRWRRLFRMMATLAEEYGDDGVRLVVWFDH